MVNPYNFSIFAFSIIRTTIVPLVAVLDKLYKHLPMPETEYKKNYIGLFVFCFQLLISVQVMGQNVNESVTADSLKVGDTFTYSLTLNKDQAYDQIIFPDSSHFGPELEIQSQQRFKVTDFKDSLVYQLQYFGTEDSRIPALPVQLVAGTDTSVVHTTPVSLYFKTVLQQEEDEFRPLKPIFDFARAWWPYMVGLILLGLLGWYLYKFYKQQGEKPTEKPRPAFQPTPFKDPLQQLETSLRQLKSFTFESEEDFKQFYVQLGDAIRTYFEDLYKIPALESTSREIIYDLERRMVDEGLIKQTRKVLREADMVKFAKFKPTEEQAQRSLAIAEEFLKIARTNDAPRVDQMRRKHQSEMEEKRQRYEQESATLETENA